VASRPCARRDDVGFPLSGATFAGNTGEVVTREQLDSGKLTIPIATTPLRSATAWRSGGRRVDVVAGRQGGSRPSFRGTLRAMRMAPDEFYLTPLYRTDEGCWSASLRACAQRSRRNSRALHPRGPGWSRWADDKTPEYLYAHLEQVFSIQSKAALEYAAGDWDFSYM